MDATIPILSISHGNCFSGGSDCALLAFAAHECTGEDPAGRGCDQMKMHNYLNTCLAAAGSRSLLLEES